MAEPKTLHDALVAELRDLYHAEKQLVRALPKMARAAGREKLRDAIENHLAETEHQLTRLEQVFEHLDERPRARPCSGMAGIIEEGSERLKEDLPEAVMDAQIIAAAQRVEHYEMAAYGTVAAWADQLGRAEVAHLLRETLEEERQADSLLTSLAESGLNGEATGAGNMGNGRGRLRKASGGSAMGRAHTVKRSVQRARA
jgi:ferritin-like metal-binding protein YciE